MVKKIDFRWVLALIVGLFLWVILTTPARAGAQDNRVTACRDPRFFNPIRIEFRNIPLDYFVWNSDAPSWGYWAQGVGMYTDLGVMVADALDVDTDGYLAGTASFVVYGDTPYTITGDANSPLCDVSTSPVQDNLPIVVTAAPPQETPVPIKAKVDCPAQHIDPSTDKSYCYTPVPSGIIPIPPPSNFKG